MIVLDTNVISAVMERDQQLGVISWLDLRVIEEICTTTINIQELWFGLGKLPSGKRKAALSESLEDAIALIGDRILPLDVESARASGYLQARQQRKGRPIALGDSLIAGIALSRGARLATRNVRHFVGLGLDIINPWDHVP